MPDESALSVTQAMTAAKRALEGVQLRVIGEVSELSDKPGYKAAYFSLCDEGATMPCLMWRDAYAESGLALKCGMLVEVTGGFSAYIPKGRMQFSVRRIELAGEGRLRVQVAALARRLEAEGLMRAERKRSLPRYPERIAVVTSPRGKAIHDVIRTLKRRYPVAELVIAGIQVEGADAADEIVHGIARALESEPDVLLLVRGGGSYEDLMPFNSEAVARAVAGSTVPVVTGIGHEPDTSIADMVADLRASTPTAAAEAAAPDVVALRSALTRERRLLATALARRVQTAAHRVRRLVERPVFGDSAVLLGPAAQTIDLLGIALARALPARLEADGARVAQARRRLVDAGPRMLERSAHSVAIGAARLEDLSPLAILTRGYAVMYLADGRSVVRSAGDVSPGDSVSVRVRDGRVMCAVESIQADEGAEPGPSGIGAPTACEGV